MKVESLNVVIHRFLSNGLSVEQAALRMGVSLDFVKSYLVKKYDQTTNFLPLAFHGIANRL